MVAMGQKSKNMNRTHRSKPRYTHPHHEHQIEMILEDSSLDSVGAGGDQINRNRLDVQKQSRKNLMQHDRRSICPPAICRQITAEAVRFPANTSPPCATRMLKELKNARRG
jgi:hypothetical protein